MADREGIIPLSRIRARLARPRGSRQVEALISADDAASAVRALPTVELYQLIHEVGFADAYELIELATPEQVRGCVDLDVWDRDRFQVEALKPWLAALIEAGFETLGAAWAGLDPELTALTLARQVYIYDLSMGEEVPDDEERPVYTTPDTFFAVAINAEDEETVVLIQRLIDDLYKADMVLARHTLMSARSEPFAELEEMSYRWRSGRLADLGYVDYYEALDVFRAIDAASVVIGEGSEDHIADADDGDEARAPRELPVPIAERVVGKSFLARALALLDEPDSRRIEVAFVVLTNKVLSALRISPGDHEGVAFGGDYAISTVNLGLEIVSGGDVERAAEALRTVSLTRVHRLGYTASLRLSRLARALAPRAVGAGEPAASAMAALLAQRPLMAAELDPAGGDPRPFASLADIRVAAECLTRLALRVAIAEAVGANLVAATADSPDIDDYIRTALVRAMLGGEPSTTPLAVAELVAFRRDCYADGSLRPSAREAAAAALFELFEREHIAAGRELVPLLCAAWLEEIDETFADLAPGSPPDPRFLSNLVTVVDRA